jgi:hypothetical protein
MLKLKTIIWEQETLSEDDEYGLYDYVDNEGLIPDEKTLRRLIEIEKQRHPDFFIRDAKFPTKKVWTYGFESNEPKFVIEQEDSGEFDVTELTRWFENISFNNRIYDYLELDLEEQANKEFWDFPPVLYHGTDEQGKLEILKNGLMPQNKTRGITNRSIGAAVFTSTELEAVDSYVGTNGAVFAINTRQMKKDGYMPTVSMETLNEEEEYKSILANKLGFYYEKEEEPGMEDTTVIFTSPIPLKYLEMIEG